MKKITNNRTSISSLMTILLISIFGFNIQKSSAQSCNSIASFPNGGKIELDTSYYQNDSLVCFYTIYCDFSNGLSHTNFFANSACIKNAKGGTWNGNFQKTYDNSISVGPDGSYKPSKPWGIKSSIGSSKVDTIKIFFILNANYKIGPTKVMIKYSTKFDSTFVCGPNATCELPVTWYKLFAEELDGIISINWSTATEVNNSMFEIQRSSGKEETWEPIGTTPSKANGGYSSTVINYDFYDLNPLQGLNYYRIRQIDNDQAFDYSPIFSARSKKEAGLNIYPNPTKSDQTVTINSFGFQEDNDNKVIIHDLVGKVILESVFTGSGNILYLNLSKGTYFITAIGKDANGRDKVFRQRLAVQ